MQIWQIRTIIIILTNLKKKVKGKRVCIIKPLEQATFLKRKSARVITVDNGGMPIDLYCPNYSLLTNCAILGTRVWYTPEVVSPFFSPATWQISEVDYGKLTLVNQNICPILFKEAFRNNIISCMSSRSSAKHAEPGSMKGDLGSAAEMTEANSNQLKLIEQASLPGGFAYDFNLKSKDKNCYIKTICSTFNLDSANNGINIFPEPSFLDATQELYTLIHAKMLGHRAVLCCFIFNQGVKTISLSKQYDLEYAGLLERALDLGVEFVCYGTKITAEGIAVTSGIDIQFF